MLMREVSIFESSVIRVKGTLVSASVKKPKYWQRRSCDSNSYADPLANVRNRAYSLEEYRP